MLISSADTNEKEQVKATTNVVKPSIESRNNKTAEKFEFYLEGEESSQPEENKREVRYISSLDGAPLNEYEIECIRAMRTISPRDRILFMAQLFQKSE
ncbi:hypothetical protein [Zooshikella ganghwensis]|uniref:Uncharacterized protein n=1 Tax=Zooshikella ganghwensis TaxID=202772 RepID=A0A4V1IP41_9GAMM|nr:hypothetical protein [Zooshikella ganghwensis]RDH45911.1 hypothetical protein B9G39_22005 [Zooshikella ganghwensis]